MSRWRARSSGTAAAAAALAALAGCGSAAPQAAKEPSGNFRVDVPVATFPPMQRLAQHTRLVIIVRNTGTRTIPDVAVTITNPKYGTAAQAFGYLLAPAPGLASRSRPAWIIDKPPGPCQYSCQSGGPGGAVTAYSNTWALGSLKPGAHATFVWGVTAIKPGIYVIQYRIAASLSGQARAVLATGAAPVGRFIVRVTRVPQQSYVNNQGQVVVVTKR